MRIAMVILSLPMLFIQLASPNVALASSQCVARCVILQRGPGTRFEIEMTPRSYNSDTVLIRDIGLLTGSVFGQLQQKCDNEVSSFSVNGILDDRIEAKLVEAISIDESDASKVVIETQEFSGCKGVN